MLKIINTLMTFFAVLFYHIYENSCLIEFIVVVFNGNKLGLSWAKLSQSWDLAKLLLSYITSVSNLDAFIFDISFCAAMLAGVSWF